MSSSWQSFKSCGACVVTGRVGELSYGPRNDAERAFRLTLCLAIVFTLNAFDLAYTQAQMMRGNFLEANQLAVAAVESGPAAAAAYKVVLLTAGAAVLYRYRRYRMAEAGAWLLVVCHVALMAWWAVYLDAVEVCIEDPAWPSGWVAF